MTLTLGGSRYAQVDGAAYVDEVLQLVNAQLDDVEDLHALLERRQWLRERVRPADLESVRRVRRELAEIVDASAAGDEPEVVSRVNALLERYPVRPRVSGHDASSWHLHVTRTDGPVVEVLAGEAAFGLALLIVENGARRLGRCADPGCGNGFLDLSTSRTRRFCSQRCATRVNVAAHRARVRAAR